jgi:hypothetical protein
MGRLWHCAYDSERTLSGPTMHGPECMAIVTWVFTVFYSLSPAPTSQHPSESVLAAPDP